MAASPFNASRGNSLSRSQRAAFGASCSLAKRRTASRISWISPSGRADIRHRVMAEQVAFPAVAFGDAVDAAPAHLEDARGAIDMLAFGRGQEGGIELRGERVAVDPEASLDCEPHCAVGCGHQRGTVDDAAGALERRLVRQLEHAFSLVCRDYAKAVRTQKARPVEEPLQFPLQGSSIAMAVASPPPMHRLATPRFRPYLRSAPISVTRMRAPEAPMGWPSAQAPPCTLTLSAGRPCSFIAAIVTTAKASLISKRSTCFAVQPVRSKSFFIAPTGAVVNQPGSCACVDWPTTTASGARPRFSALERRIITSA